MARAFKAAFFVLAVTAASQVNAAIVVYTSDFIADGTRTGFNGFEGIPNDGGDPYTYSTIGGGPYSEGGITVEQVNGDGGNDIWLNYFSPEGAFGWYPDGGDYGFTKLTLTGGGDFTDVGFLLGTGWYGGATAAYELYDNGVLVLSGTIATFDAGQLPGGTYLGFGGGGFDTILLSDNYAGGGSPLPVMDGSYQALAIDAIEIRGAVVPEPASLALVGVPAVLGLLVARRRMKASA